MTQQLGVGDRLPPFSLKDQDDAMVRSDDLLAGGPVVLYFYPKDETAVCTRQACQFRDSYEDFVAAGAQVVGVSRDRPDSHRSFAGRHGLPFVLLSDADGDLRRKMGVPQTLGLLDGRVTYVIDTRGVIRHTFSSQVRVGAHVDRALTMVRELKREAR